MLKVSQRLLTLNICPHLDKQDKQAITDKSSRQVLQLARSGVSGHEFHLMFPNWLHTFKF